MPLEWIHPVIAILFVIVWCIAARIALDPRHASGTNPPLKRRHL